MNLNIGNILFNMINKEQAIALAIRAVPRYQEVRGFLKETLKYTDQDIDLLFSGNGQVKSATQAVSAVAKQEPPKAAPNLPTPGMLRDHEGKDYTIEQISQILAQAKQLAEQQAQAQVQAAQAPAQPAQATQAPAKFPRSCLGCRDALGGTDQAGFGQSCLSKNCKGDPSRPNYSPLA